VRQVIRLWLSGLGLGYLPIAPATWGSLLGLGIAYGLSYLPWLLRSGLALTGWLVSAWLLRQSLGKMPDDPDPRWIVADEYWALALLPTLVPLTSPTMAALAFFFFRFWDICKVFPADWVEALPVPWGILVDDVVAMIYAALCLLLIA
jgi:phosphatidylglycerophosphatase A